MFVLAALEYSQQRLEERRHISGRESALSCRDLALERFGVMSRLVLEHWGLRTSGDIGDVVFTLVDLGLLMSQPTDSREEFIGVFDFDQAFERDTRGAGRSRSELDRPPPPPNASCALWSEWSRVRNPRRSIRRPSSRCALARAHATAGAAAASGNRTALPRPPRLGRPDPRRSGKQWRRRVGHRAGTPRRRCSGANRRNRRGSVPRCARRAALTVEQLGADAVGPGCGVGRWRVRRRRRPPRHRLDRCARGEIARAIVGCESARERGARVVAVDVPAGSMRRPVRHRGTSLAPT